MGHLSNLKLAAGRTKSIDDPLLNRLGLQVARSVAARQRLRWRRWPDPEPRIARWARQLRTEGWVEVPDLLAPERFAAVCRAADSLLDDPAQTRDRPDQGGNDLEVIWRHDVDQRRRGDLDAFFGHPDLLGLAGAVTKTQLDVGAGRCVIQRLTQRRGAQDLQSTIHCDTFQPTHKAWLYLTDVTPDDGPLIYHPRSHRLDLATLRATYRESVGANEGSRRIEADEATRRGLPPIQLVRPANTLVVADTSGYHGRAQGAPPGRRVALQIELRLHPFRRPRRLGEDTSRATGGGGPPQ